LPWVGPKCANLLTIKHNPCEILHIAKVDNKPFLLKRNTFRHIKNIAVGCYSRIVLNPLIIIQRPIAQLLKNSTFGTTKLSVELHIPLPFNGHYQTLLTEKGIVRDG